MLCAKEPARASATGHNLVMDQQNIILVANLADAAHVPCGRDKGPGRCPAHGFNDKGKNIFGPLFQNFGLEHIGIMQTCRRIIGIQTVQIGARCRDFRHHLHHRIKRCRHRGVARDRKRPKRCPMITGVARDDLGALRLVLGQRVLPRQL